MTRDQHEPLRIAHVITKLAVGGAQESVLVTCRGLDRADFDQTVLTGSEVDREGDLHRDAEQMGIRVVTVPALVRAIRPLSDLRATWWLVRWFRRSRPDIVHTHSSKAGLVGRLAARIARVPVVVHSVHGWSFHEESGAGARALAVALERIAARLSDAIVVESSTDLPKGLGRRIGRAFQYALIRNGIDLDRFRGPHDRAATRGRLDLPPDAFVVGSVGRLAEQKNPLMMVDAWARFLADVPDATFLWVGDGPLRPDVEHRCVELGVDRSFRVLGVRRDVADLLAAVDVFALSSSWEGLPRTVTEAMAAGLPVVATSVDGTVEAIEHDVSGLLVDRGDVDGLARALRRLHADPALRACLAAAAAERSAWFSHEVMLDDLASLYRRLVAGGPVAGVHRPLKVVHVITGLGYGGAERQLEALVLVRTADVEHTVISLTGLGPVGEELRARGASVTALGATAGLRGIVAAARLRRVLARSGADVVQTWLYHADVLGGLVARSLRLPVIWSVRMTWMDRSWTKRTTHLVARVAARLSSSVPRRIVFNSARGRSTHVEHGFDATRTTVIGNALDVARFRPDPDAGERLRKRLGLADDVLLVGAIGRFDPQKGYDVLVAAMGEAHERVRRSHLVLAGPGVEPANAELRASLAAAAIDDRTSLLGPLDDVQPVVAGLDLLVSASRYGESVPNVVVEAVACGVPVVMTDVADAELVGDLATVVPPGDAAALADAIVEALRRPSSTRRPPPGLLSVEDMAAAYRQVYAEVTGRVPDAVERA